MSSICREWSFPFATHQKDPRYYRTFGKIFDETHKAGQILFQEGAVYINAYHSKAQGQRQRPYDDDVSQRDED